MVEVTGVHDADRDADSTALSKLSEALGGPSQEAIEKAKALFPFVAFEASMDSEESLTAPEGRPTDSADRPSDSAGRPTDSADRPSGSAGRHPAAPGR
ncbi:hypothetical protein [Streptomyces sp. NPDC047525]|uniref:hypothetical protein n=1 Tax=Streptomyces sp. NPDC047525 TaxID=3155264 RepID=UPI003405A390